MPIEIGYTIFEGNSRQSFSFAQKEGVIKSFQYQPQNAAYTNLTIPASWEERK